MSLPDRTPPGSRGGEEIASLGYLRALPVIQPNPFRLPRAEEKPEIHLAGARNGSQAGECVAFRSGFTEAIPIGLGMMAVNREGYLERQNSGKG